MNATFSLQDQKACITLDGSFTYESHREFKAATSNALTHDGVIEIEINFAGVDYPMERSQFERLQALLRHLGYQCDEADNDAGKNEHPRCDVYSFGKLFQPLGYDIPSYRGCNNGADY